MQQPATWLVTSSSLSTASQKNDDSSTTASEQQRHDFTQALNALETRFLNNLKTVKVKVPPGALLQVIAQFPKLFEDYPLPVLINSAILKLADWFRQHSVGNNLIRFYIYKVIKSASERHLSKVINVEELVRRILSVVMLNNDTIARAITLRLLGCMSIIISEKLDVQHAIIHRLDKSTEHVEIDAAICAADRICARSEQFPGAICARLAAKLEDPSTPLRTRLKLVRIFRHMHRDLGLARKARSICLRLLEQFSTSEDFTLDILRTLTLLSGQALIDRAEQIDLLLKYALNDPREVVQRGALGDLMVLGRDELMFDEWNVVSLLRITTTCPSLVVQTKSLRCLRQLLATRPRLVSSLVAGSAGNEFWALLRKCEETVMVPERGAGAVACAWIMGTVYACARKGEDMEGKGMNVDEDEVGGGRDEEIDLLGRRIVTALSLFFMVWKSGYALATPTDKESAKVQIKETLRCLALVLSADGNLAQSAFTDILAYFTDIHDDLAPLLTKCLTVIAKSQPDVAIAKLGDVLAMLEASVEGYKNQSASFLNLFKLTVKSILPSSPIAVSTSLKLDILLHSFGGFDDAQRCYTRRQWEVYMATRDAAMEGWHEVARNGAEGLVGVAESESSRCWLQSLADLVKAECLVAEAVGKTNADTDGDVDTGRGHALGQARLKVLNSAEAAHIVVTTRLQHLAFLDHAGRTFRFQKWFTMLRLHFVQYVRDLLAAIDVFMDSAGAADSGRLAWRHKSNLLACVTKFERLAPRYELVAGSFFDLNKEAIASLQSYQVCCLTFRHTIVSAIRHGETGEAHIDPYLIPLLSATETSPSPISEKDAIFSTHGVLRAMCMRMVSLVRRWSENGVNKTGETLSERRGGSTVVTLLAELEQFAIQILRIPLRIPGYYFSTSKAIDLQVTISPTLGSTGNDYPIRVKRDHKQVVSFEGIVQLAAINTGQRRRRLKEIDIRCFVTRENVATVGDEMEMRMAYADPARHLRGSVGKGGQPGAILLSTPTTYRVPIVNSYVSCTALVRFPQRHGSDNPNPTQATPTPTATTTIMGERSVSLVAAMGPDDEVGWLNVAVNVIDESGAVWVTEVQRCSRVGFL